MPKRNAQGAGSIRQRKDGTWEARYTAGRNPGTGKQVQKSVYGKTQKEVRQKLTQVTAAIDEGIYIEPSRLTLGVWLDIWLSEYVKNAVKYMTHHSYESICKTHIKPAFAAIRLPALNTHTIQKFYNDTHNGTDDKKGLSAKTIKNIHGVLHKALKQAVMLGYIKHNPADACKLPRIVKKEIKPLDEIETTAFLEAISGHKYETIYYVTLFSGMRQSEALGLQWECVDFKNGTILINKQLQKEKTKGGKYFLSTVKNDKVRVLSPAPSIIEALRIHKIEQNKLRLQAGDAWVNNGYVFTDELGEHLTHVTVYKNYKRLVSSIDISDARFHDLRHTYAVAALQSGMDIKSVQADLGHYSTAFTMDTYAHITDTMRKQNAQKMEGYIKGIKLPKG